MDSDDYYDEDDELNSIDEGFSSDEGSIDGDNSRWQKHYTVVEEERIRQLQENNIAEVSTFLSVSRGTACTLLRRRNWSPTSVFEEWFAGEERIRRLLGLLPEPKSPKQGNNNNKILCKICFEETKIENTFSASCGHPFCLDCWKTHISISINDGPGCLSLRCPEPKCRANAGLDVIDQLTSENDKQKYYKYLARSYIEGHPDLKWCPAPGCDLAIWLDKSNDHDEPSFDVTCDCSHTFCWNCTEENHRPVSCETVKKWIKLNTSETENTTWLSAYTRPCPKCNRNIEKNQGCNHMTCGRPCGYEFCWLCLEEHKDGHSCNSYDEHKKRDRDLETTRKDLMRYAHYYSRWASHHNSRGIMLSDLKWARDELVDILVEKQRVQFGDVQSVIGAMEQIAEGRRVLKWSYAYGYYLAWGEREFFEYVQGEAESMIERLHYCVETELKKYCKAKVPSDDFKEYLEKVVNLNSIVKNHFQNLVRALENGFSILPSNN